MRRTTRLITVMLVAGGALACSEWGYGAGQTTEPYLDYCIEHLAPTLRASVVTSLDHSLHALTPPLSPEKVQAWYSHSLSDIRQVLALHGYFEPVIRTKLLYQHGRPQAWHALYDISIGPPVRIHSLKIFLQGDGTENVLLKKTINELHLHTGDIFLSERYEQAKQTLLTAAIAEGYLDAHFTQHRVAISRFSRTADITLVLKTAPRYYFGPIRFKQSILKDALLRRYLAETFQVDPSSAHAAHTPYSSEKLMELRDKLSNSGYFQDVSIIEPRVRKQNQRIPITLQLTPRPSQQYTLGVGYSTDVGARATLGWESRCLNRLGHKFSLISQLSQLQNSLQATYAIPGKYPSTDTYAINLSFVSKKLAQVDTHTHQLGVSSTKQWKRWKSNLFLNYQIEHFNYVNRTTIKTHLLTPGINLSLSQFDDPIYASHGYWFNIRLQAAHQSVLSSTSFLQIQLQPKIITSWNTNSRLIVRGDIGYTVTSDLTNFPPSLLFYAGGSQSLRGYDYQALGPGKYLIVGSVEYQHRIINNFYGALFFDLGNAVNHFPLSPQRSAGVGLVWVSPLGPMELTLGKALDLSGRPLRLQFNIGIDLA